MIYQCMPEKSDSGEEGCHAMAAGTWSTPALSDEVILITNKKTDMDLSYVYLMITYSISVFFCELRISRNASTVACDS